MPSCLYFSCIGIALFVLVYFFFHWLNKNKLYSKQKQLDVILNSIDDFVYIKDTKSRFIAANHKNLEIFGVKSKKGFIGKSDHDFYPLDMANKYLSDEEKILETGRPLIGIIEKGLDKNGDIIEMSTTKYPIFNKKKEVIGIVGIGRDITKLIEYERKLEDLNQELEKANKEKETMLTVIAHDLKNPFTVLKGFADLLAMKFETLSQERKWEYVKQVSTSTHSLTHLIDNLLNWSVSQRKGIKVNPVKLDVIEAIKSNIEQHRLEADIKRISVEFVYDRAQDFFIYVDTNMFNTIIRNLLSNAIKFTPHTGKVFFRVDLENNNVKIDVADTGLGLKQGFIEAFDKGVRTQTSEGTDGEKGTGLGLWVCKNFVEQNGGTINVRKNTPNGAVFMVKFPTTL